jgi:hypothetical protein
LEGRNRRMRDPGRHESERVKADKGVEDFEVELGVDGADVHGGVVELCVV